MMWRKEFFVALVTGCLLSAPAHAALLISEVLYNEVGGDFMGEWVEIYNGTGDEIDLSDHKIGDEETSGATGATEGMFQFPAGATIAANEVQIISSGGNVFESTYGFAPNYEVPNPEAGFVDHPGVPDMTTYAAWDSDGDRLNMSNGNDQVLLLDGDDNQVDVVNWGNNFSLDPGLDSAAESDGQSYQRTNALIDTDTASDWSLTAGPPAGASWTNSAAPGTVAIPEPAAALLTTLALVGACLVRRTR